jgi:hypothetical protein
MAGRRFSGLLNEPAVVTVNGNPAKVMSTNKATLFRFEASVNLAVVRTRWWSCTIECASR